MTESSSTSDTQAAADAAAAAAPKPTAAARRDAEAQAALREPRFTAKRLRSREGASIVSSAFDGDPPPGAASAGSIAGALYGVVEPDGGWTPAEIRNLLIDYLNREG